MMINGRGKRTVTRVWLQAELNAQLKRERINSEQECSARVRQILPQGDSRDANWSAELFEAARSEECRARAELVINAMRGKVDVAW